MGAGVLVFCAISCGLAFLVHGAFHDAETGDDGKGSVLVKVSSVLLQETQISRAGQRTHRTQPASNITLFNTYHPLGNRAVDGVSPSLGHPAKGSSGGLRTGDQG